MKSRARISFLCLFGLTLVLSLSQPVHARTTLGLAPAAYALDAGQRAALSRLQSSLAAKIGQPVAIRSLASEPLLQDWLLRFREVDAALLTREVFRRQPAGALVPLVDVYTKGDAAPSLVLVVAPWLDQALLDAWRDAFLELGADAAARTALDDAGIASIARYGVKPATAIPVVAAPTPAPIPVPPPAPVTSPAPAPAATTALVPPRVDPAVSAMPLPAAPEAKPAAAESLANQAGLSGLIRRVVEQNQRLQMQRAQFDIKLAEEEKSFSIFEPSLVASLQLEDSDMRNTAEESASRLFEEVYHERNWNYSASLQGLAPTGARYKLAYSLRDLSNTLTDDYYGTGEHQMSLGLSLRQPLLKNAGIGVTRSGIDAAAAESRASLHDYRREMMKTVGEAGLIYWRYYQAREKHKLRQESVRIAEQILNDNRERLRTGKMAETEVLEAQAALASRRSLLSEAAQELREYANHLRRILSITSADESLPLEVGEPPAFSPPSLDRAAILQKSFELRPDYLAALERMKQADIKIAYARNQRWPELDLTASYTLNGLDVSRSSAWEQIEEANYASWAVGMEFRLPLQGGIESRSDLKKQELEKKRLLWALKDIQATVTNGVDTALHQVASATERLDYINGSLALRRQLLEAEKARLQAGKSNSRQVLEKEDSYRVAQEEALESRVKLQTALIDLEQADGSILLRNGVEIMGRDF